MTQAESWAQDQTHMKWLKPYCTILFCTNYNWIMPLINISTNIKLFKQQEFLQLPILICVAESANNVSITDSLAPTVHTSFRVEHTNHHTNLFPFTLHPNTDTWCTSSLSSLSHVLIHTLVKSLSPPLSMSYNGTKNLLCYNRFCREFYIRARIIFTTELQVWFAMPENNI